MSAHNDNTLSLEALPLYQERSEKGTAEFARDAHAKLLEIFADEIVPGPLNGMVVFSMEQQICGPFSTRLLADKGALVIKAEPPEGDSKRHNSTKNTFGTFNVGKKSVVLSRDEESEQLKFYLLNAADVIVDNRSRAARVHDRVLEHFYAQPHATPKIYTLVNGYGEHSERITYDRALQADVGYVDLNNGKAIPNSPSDMAVGNMVAFEVLSYWSMLGRMDEAQKRMLQQEHNNIIRCDISMVEIAMFNAMNQVFTLEDTGRKGSSIVPYGYFDTKDGRFAVAIGTDRQYAYFCDLLGLEEIKKYDSNQLRAEHQAEVDLHINEAMQARTNEEWERFFSDKRIAYAPVVSFKEAIDRNRDQIKTAGNGKFMVSGVDSNLFSCAHDYVPAPELGQHTVQIDQALRALDRGDVTHQRLA